MHIFIQALLYLALPVNLWANTCFSDGQEQAAVITALKAQALCANSDMPLCQELLFPKPSPKIQASPIQTNLMAPSCAKPDSSLSLGQSQAQLASLLVLYEPISAFSRREYVNNLVDFYHHTSLHKKRVVALALAALDKFPQEFPGLEKQIVMRVLGRHDDAKIDPAIRDVDGKPFYQKLFKHFGAKPPRELIDRLNQADEKIMQTALGEEGLLPNPKDNKALLARKAQQVESLLKLEKLADHVDRGMSPVSAEEFGREMWKKSAEAKKASDKGLQKMARFLEIQYKKITGTFSYHKLSPKDFFKLAKKIDVDSKFSSLMSGGKTAKEIGARSFEGLTWLLKRQGVSKAMAFGSRALIGASALVDGLALGFYSPSTACSGASLHYDMINEGGKCVPAIGLTENYLKFLSLPEDQMRKALNEDAKLCRITKKNAEINKQGVFSNIQCSQGRATLSTDNDTLEVEFDQRGELQAIDLKRFHTPLETGLKVGRLIYENGVVIKTCSKISFGGIKERVCQEADTEKLRYSKRYGILAALNYNIAQAVACCLGAGSEFSSHTTCSK